MSKQDLENIFEDFLESENSTADKKVMESYKRMDELFEDYICNVQEDMFKKAFLYGFNEGMKQAKATA